MKSIISNVIWANVTATGFQDINHLIPPQTIGVSQIIEYLRVTWGQFCVYSVVYGCAPRTSQLQLSDILFASNHSRQSAALEEKSSSVPVRGAVRLNGPGVRRLVVLDGTKVKVLMQAATKTAGSHLVRSNGELTPFTPQGQCWCRRANSNDTSKTVIRSLLMTFSCAKRMIAKEKCMLTIMLTKFPRSVTKKEVP